ncbi:MAG: hypothetical protein CVV27_18025 [Candidatus Melainabacteria bacterium HGW-Melainabacteria-1]|nr:MAG: hypothetical protein CVV27_18025 [Candidatus Melainabacteria bacterium HGW-Melainabacteria-1]
MTTSHKEFSLRYLRQDLPASLAVFLVAVPLCLGIAHASGTPLLSGLITGIIGGLVVGALSKSPLSVSGPAAGLTAIVAAAAMELGSFPALLTATFLAGLIQIGLGLLKAGSIGAYIPSAVIRGMLSAIGIILILKQLPHLMGYDAEAEGNLSFVVEANKMTQQAAEHDEGHGIGTTFSLLWDAVQNLQPQVFALGLVAIAVMLLWDKTLAKRLKMIPSSLIAVLLGTGIAMAYGLLGPDWVLSANHLVQLPPIRSLGDFMQQTSFPDFGALLSPQVYTVALTIALVASIETLLSIEAVDKLDSHKRHTPTNRELLAQGAGNSLCGLLGGLPMTSVIVRSSVNQVSGAETKLSTMLHGVWLILAVGLGASLINQIPLAALAAVLIMTGVKLASPKQMIALWRNGRDQFLPYLVTVVAIVLTDLLIGVLIGLAVSATFILYSHYRTKVVERIDEGNTCRLVFGENLTFLNKARIMDLLDAIPDGTQVCLDTSRCKYIDHDVLEAIQEFRIQALDRDILILAENRPQTGLLAGPDHARRLDQLLEDQLVDVK